jgi:hypothetical protein
LKGEKQMRTISILLTLFGLLFGVAGQARGDVNIGVSIGEEGLKAFYFAIGAYYRVPEKEVVIIRERRIPDQEIPVVLFIAARAKVAPGVVVNLRLRGKTWMDITLHFGLTPEVYYVPVKTEVKGPPYGKAYGHYKKNKSKQDWKKVTLSNDDVINLVNLRFISEYHRCPPEEVIKMRSEGRKFVAINDGFKKDKGKGKESKEQGDENKSKGKGKGKNG